MPSLIMIARHYYPSPGAATNRLEATVKPLIEAGWSVHVVTRHVDGHTPLDSSTEKGPSGETISRVSGDRQTGIGLQRLIDLVRFPVAAARAVASTGLKADVVLADPPPTVGLAMLFLARRHRAASVYYLADSWHNLLRASTSRFARLLAPAVGVTERMVLRRSSLVLAVTDGFADLARKQSSRVELIRNGVDGAVFRAGLSSDVEIEVPDGVPYFLYAGNFGEAHGAGIFAEAAMRDWEAGARDYGLVFMGYGSDASEIERAATRHPTLCKIVAPQPPEVAAAAFRQAVGGLASVRATEHLQHQMSVKALASIVSGAPVVYVGAGPFAEEVNRERWGHAVPPDPELVRSSLTELARDPWPANARDELSSRAALRYDNRTHGARLVGLMTELGSETS